MIRKYEFMFLLNPKLDEKEVAELSKNIEEKINGKIVKQENWGKKELSYEIKKQKEAIYLLYFIETESDNIDVIKSLVAVNKSILRSLIIMHEKKWPFDSKTLNLKEIKSYKKNRSYNKND